MKSSVFLGIVMTLFSVSGAAIAQRPVVLYDPLAKLPETSHSEGDEQLLKDKVVPNAAAHWKETESCDGGNLNIIGAVDGAFTRPGSKQRAIVYELCQTGNGFANNGITVIENGVAVFNFIEEGGWNLEVSKAPDLNKNGRDELIIETGGGMHQGYTGSSVTLVELSETSATELGVYLAYTNECENRAPNKYCDRSYKITATAGTNPTFFAQKFTNRGTEEKPRWVVSGKAVAAKPIPDTESKYTLLK